MADLNRTLLIGRLTFDPELRRIPSGNAVTELRMAVNKTWTDKNGERKEEVCYLDVVVWGKQAETACQYLKKGSQVFIEGSLKMEQWDDKQTGEKRSKIKVQADRVQFLDSKPKDGNGQSDYPPQGQQRRGAPQAAPAGRGPTPGRAVPQTEPEMDDADIPF